MTRRLPKDGLCLHAYCPALTVDAAADLVRAGGTCGWPLIERRQEASYPSWAVGDARVPLHITLNPSAPWSELYVAMSDEHLTLYGADRLASFLDWLSARSRVGLSRTFATGGVGFVTERELSGDLEFVDWFQYWSEPIVSRWGITKLLTGPFERILPHDDGGCSLLLSREPDDENMSRRAAADFLGITLRPLLARNPQTGEHIVLPWR